MKSKVTILATLITCFSLFSFSTIAADANVKDRVGEIKLRKGMDGGTRSGSATAVTAYISGDVITVETENYAGDILVEIFDTRGILQFDAHFDHTDYAVVDISSLPPGQYEIAVTLDYRYKGNFVK